VGSPVPAPTGIQPAPSISSLEIDGRVANSVNIRSLPGTSTGFFWNDSFIITIYEDSIVGRSVITTITGQFLQLEGGINKGFSITNDAGQIRVELVLHVERVGFGRIASFTTFYTQIVDSSF
jgi:hypothetical protein